MHFYYPSIMIEVFSIVFWSNQHKTVEFNVKLNDSNLQFTQINYIIKLDVMEKIFKCTTYK